jgi:hypothetical protein
MPGKNSIANAAGNKISGKAKKAGPALVSEKDLP